MATATESASEVRHVSLSDIRIDGGTQCRVHLNEETVNEYKELLVGDFEFPPAIVYFDGSDHWMADGFHRYFAYQKSHHETMPCEVREGTKEDAQWHAYGANKAHGLRRSQADKEKAVRDALCHPNGSRFSNRRIAEHVGVSEAMVRSHREQLESTARITQSETREGADGRKINNSSEKRSAAQKKRQADCAKNAVKPAAEETREELETAAEQESGQDQDAQLPSGSLSRLCKLLESHLGKAIRAVDDIANAAGGNDKFTRNMRDGVNASLTALADFRRSRR